MERWQTVQRGLMQDRLRESGIGPIFKEDFESPEEEIMDEDEDDGEAGDGMAD